MRGDRGPAGHTDSPADLAEEMIVTDGTGLRPFGFQVGAELLLLRFQPRVSQRPQPRHQEVEERQCSGSQPERAFHLCDSKTKLRATNLPE
jgi:hypothetical protein